MSFSAGAGGPAPEGGGEDEGEVGELGEPVLEESLQALLEEGDGGAGKLRNASSLRALLRRRASAVHSRQRVYVGS